MKNLETEYKDLCEQEFAQIDADALWNKIESALPEKTDKLAENDYNVLDFTSKKKWYNKRVISLIGSAVAVLLLAFIFKTYDGSRITNSKTEATATYNKTEAAEMTAETAEVEKEEYVNSDEAPSYSECEEPMEEQSEACLLPTDEQENVVIEITFEVTWLYEDDWFRCTVLEANEIVELGEEILIEMTDELEVEGRFCKELIYLGEDGGVKYFSLVK